MATWAEKLSCRQNEVSKRVVFEIKLLFLDWLKEVCQSRPCQELIVEAFLGNKPVVGHLSYLLEEHCRRLLRSKIPRAVPKSSSGSENKNCCVMMYLLRKSYNEPSIIMSRSAGFREATPLSPAGLISLGSTIRSPWTPMLWAMAAISKGVPKSEYSRLLPEVSGNLRTYCW